MHSFQPPAAPRRRRSSAAKRVAMRDAATARAAATPGLQVPCADMREQVPADIRQVAAGSGMSKKKDTARRALSITSGRGDDSLPSIATGHGRVRGEQDTDGMYSHRFGQASGPFDGIAYVVTGRPDSVRATGVQREVAATDARLYLQTPHGAMPTD